jgi:photosystem II stability/assembly factor-like uncharacterized protein
MDKPSWMSSRGALLLGLLVSLGCSSSSTPPPSGDGGVVHNPPPKAWRSAVGAGGTFAQTFDEQGWSTRTVADRDLLAVTCVGNLLGWVAGAGGFLARTDDGGASWEPLSSGFAQDLRAIRFADASFGVVAGDRGALGVSRDGGAHWIQVSTVTSALRGVAIARDPGILVVVGDGGVVLRSTDAGSTWATVIIEGAGDLSAVAADAAARRVLVADRVGGIWTSADQALTFTREASAPRGLGALSLDESLRAIAAGDAGLVMSRDPSGRWSLDATGSTADLHATLLSEETSYDYVAGDQGTLLARRPGEPWAQIALETEATLFGLEDL